MTNIIALLIGILLGGFFAGGLVWCWLSDRFYFVNKTKDALK